MDVFDILYVEAHLSELVDRAALGEAFVIAKDGKPLVKVVPFAEPPAHEPQIIGFMKGEIEVPDDFDSMGQEEIEELFYGIEE
jgi:antitoxin (DNA-binding transcriptional repressor) of toxin-antitoxin stability system